MCVVCCGPAAAGHAACFACRWVGRLVGHPLAPVFPVRLCPLPGPLYTVLMGYKESPVADARRRFAPMARELLESFLAAHAGCLGAAAGGPVDMVLPVPSSSRPGGSPLGGVEGLARAVCTRLPGATWSPHVLVRATAPVGHMRPHPGAYSVPAPVRPEVAARRVLLLDDTYVSGARAQSAAAALRRGGARTVVIVALGRVLRPDRSPAQARFLRHHLAPVTERPMPGGCCRCLQPGTPMEKCTPVNSSDVRHSAAAAAASRARAEGRARRGGP